MADPGLAVALAHGNLLGHLHKSHLLCPVELQTGVSVLPFACGILQLGGPSQISSCSHRAGLRAIRVVLGSHCL